MKRLTSTWNIVTRSTKYGRYNELALLGIEYDNKKNGLFKSCPVCGTVNFIKFRNPVLNKEGNKVISAINWVECSKCHVSYGLDS